MRSDDERISSDRRTANLDELISDLQRPEAYECAVDAVTLRQTHISLLFFAGNLVYKVKKPFNLGFLDFSTLEKRCHFCEEEVRLNRRLAPDDYLGVALITRDANGRLRIGGAGEPVEYAVCMRRLQADRMMDHLLKRGCVDAGDINRIVDVLVPFHNAAARDSAVLQFGTPEAVRERIGRNLAELEEVVEASGESGMLTTNMIQCMRSAQQRFMALHEALFNARAHAGYIREGHGDLHAANICLPGDRIVIYDCIEFAAELRCCDVACDLAFLAMDLGYRGRDDLREGLINQYATIAGDGNLATLIPFYERHYAMVRAKVHLIESTEPENSPEQCAAARNAADRYALYAAASAAGGSLILMCGLPGAGKSWLADRLAPLLHASVVQSDAVRKSLAGIDPSEHAASTLTPEHYTDEWTRRTYAAMLDQARVAIKSGRMTIIDANLPAASLRRPFVEFAGENDLPLFVIHVVAEENVVRNRLANRELEASAISDADQSVYEAAQSRFEPPDEIPPEKLVTIQSPADALRVAAQVVERLLARRYESS